MSEDRITSETPSDSPAPLSDGAIQSAPTPRKTREPAAEPQPGHWLHDIANFAVHSVLGLIGGGLGLLLLTLLRQPPEVARGAALLVFLGVFFMARMAITWPHPHVKPGKEGGEEPSAPLALHLANFGVHFGISLAVALLLGVILHLVGINGKVIIASGAIACLALSALLRMSVHWPLPKAVATAAPHLPRDVRPAETGGREIVETVVFVVVLVLMLKSFAAEAFVIPTGSMAETLYGYQKIVKCPACGHEFPVNCSDEVDPQDRAPAIINGCQCDNCRAQIRMTARNWRDPKPGMQPGDYYEIADPGPSTGDRVLVGKFLYDQHLPHARPNRHDVVVFKYPKEPQRKHVAMNYIKRLVGLPGETIAIYGGDLYVLSPEKSPKHADESPIDEGYRWEKKMMAEDDPAALEKWKAGEFKILQKPPSVLLAMMRNVYDNDFLPADLAGKRWQRWKPESEGWEELKGGRTFRYGGGNTTGWLRYRHLLRDMDGKPSWITDFMGYNSKSSFEFDHGGTEWGRRILGETNGVNWVGDLIIECEVKIDNPEGELVLELVRCGERYQARWKIGGDCALSRGNTGTEEQLATRPGRLGKGTYKVRFANVDRRLTVWVDGELPFGDGVDYSPPKEQGPTEADKQPVAIGITGTGATVSKIKLFRDSFYTRKPGDADVSIAQWEDPDRRATLNSMEPKTLHVQPGHYLCLGDNSPASSDGRDWGLVPERLFLGRALLVYWPFDRAGRIR